MQRYNWNPWHGCHKKSAGCLNCYMFAQDATYHIDPNVIKRVKTNFTLPLKRNRARSFVIPSGSVIATCLTSDFFLEEADLWRAEAWQIMVSRRDCLFYIITKRPERIAACLPADWGEKYNHILINVTAENQAMIDERMPILMHLPLAYKGVVVAPILGSVDLRKYLQLGQITAVSVGGESGQNARITNFDDVVSLYQQCIDYQVNFVFHQTGSRLLKDGKIYLIPHSKEYTQAAKANLTLSFHSPIS